MRRAPLVSCGPAGLVGSGRVGRCMFHGCRCERGAPCGGSDGAAEGSSRADPKAGDGRQRRRRIAHAALARRRRVALLTPVARATTAAAAAATATAAASRVVRRGAVEQLHEEERGSHRSERVVGVRARRKAEDAEDDRALVVDEHLVHLALHVVHLRERRGGVQPRGRAWAGVGGRGRAWAGVGKRGQAWASVGKRGQAWASVGKRGQAWASVAWRAVAWRSVACSGGCWGRGKRGVRAVVYLLLQRQHRRLRGDHALHRLLVGRADHLGSRQKGRKRRRRAEMRDASRCWKPAATPPSSQPHHAHPHTRTPHRAPRGSLLLPAAPGFGHPPHSSAPLHPACESGL